MSVKIWRLAIVAGIAGWGLLFWLVAMPAQAQAPVRLSVMLDCGTLDGAGRVLVVVNGVAAEPVVIACKREPV